MENLEKFLKKMYNLINNKNCLWRVYMASKSNSSIENVYKLNGNVPLGVAIPFGLQHILVMFVSNVTPIILVTGVAQVNGGPMSTHLVSFLIQNCMFIAGVASLIQIAGIWKIGSRLPIIMGISFTFLAAMMTAAGRDYNIAMGAVIVGECVEGLLGLCYKYWKGILSPILSVCVVCGTVFHFSLLVLTHLVVVELIFQISVLLNIGLSILLLL